MRAKFRAAMVSAVAPHSPMRPLASSPGFLGLGIRQGPWEQILQQDPSAPMGQGFIFSARSKMVSTPAAWAFCNISTVAGSTDAFVGSSFFSFSSAITSS